MNDGHTEPASPVVLTREEHVLIGEMVEILGWTDDLMAQMVDRVDRSMQLSRMTNVRQRTRAWADAMRGTHSDPAIGRLIDIAEARYPTFAELRNDFVHALFEGDYVEAGYVEPGYQTTSATRHRTGITRPTSDLDEARDMAAAFSCLFAHIDFCTRLGADPTESPWHSRIDVFLQ